MKKTLSILLLLMCLAVPSAIAVGCAEIQVCFTPGGDCAGLIVSGIESARKEGAEGKTSSSLVKQFSLEKRIIRGLLQIL